VVVVRTTRRYLRPALLFLLLACSPANRVTAQDKPAPASHEFEVASVKPVDPKAPGPMGARVYPGGRVIISGFPLKGLAATAFHLSSWQISGGDEWTAKDEYVVEAKPPEHLQPAITDLKHTLFGIEDERLREMLQALLIDRFQLQFHCETKTGDVYLLRRNGKTLRLRPSQKPLAEGGSFGSIGHAAARWVIAATTMPQLTRFASANILHAPVVDRTGLSGSFDYRQTALDPEPNYSDPSDSFLRLIPELGLKLERSKGPVETFVIDHAAKPSPN
jgi:uncharacterized protein (TIGR03435 family)